MAATKKHSEMIVKLLDGEDVGRVEMWEVRDACGWDRLGTHVVKDISRKLNDAGIGHLPASPADLPVRANNDLWLYVKASGIGKIIGDVLSPTEAGMRRLQTLGDGDADEKVNAIRAILGD